jgi:putative lipoic acid-binding regulatory protein
MEKAGRSQFKKYNTESEQSLLQRSKRETDAHTCLKTRKSVRGRYSSVQTDPGVGPQDDMEHENEK